MPRGPASLPKKLPALPDLDDVPGAWEDALPAVAVAWRLWLDENKRMEDHVLVARSTEALLTSGLLRAERLVVRGADAAALGAAAAESEEGAGHLRALPSAAPAPSRHENSGGADAQPADAAALRLHFSCGARLWSVCRRRAAADEEWTSRQVISGCWKCAIVGVPWRGLFVENIV